MTTQVTLDAQPGHDIVRDMRRRSRPSRHRSPIGFSLLGPLELTGNRHSLTPRAYKVRVLLAALLMRSNTIVPVEAIINALWPDLPPRTALQATRVYISQLRQTLADAGGEPSAILVTIPGGYRLEVDEDELDTLEFLRRCSLARQLADEGRYDDAAEQYRTADALWRGPALADVRGACPHLEAAAVQLEEVRVAALERRIDLDLCLGRHRDLVAELFALTAEYPLNESLYARLMIALYRSGRTSDALAVYQDVRGTLVDELGVEPNRNLQSVHQAVLKADPDILKHTERWAA